MNKKPIVPSLAYFNQITPGDARKTRADAADADTGGGAMDLRFPLAFVDFLNQMFPREGDEGRRLGTVQWMTGDKVMQAEVELHPPTNARPAEARIGKIYQIGGWAVDEMEYEGEQTAGRRMFFILVQDRDGNVWARTIRERDLDGEYPPFRDYVRRRIRETRGSESVRGTFNFETEVGYP